MSKNSQNRKKVNINIINVRTVCKSKTDKSDQTAFQKRLNHFPPVSVFPLQTPQFSSNLIFQNDSEI